MIPSSVTNSDPQINELNPTYSISSASNTPASIFCMPVKIKTPFEIKVQETTSKLFYFINYRTALPINFFEQYDLIRIEFKQLQIENKVPAHIPSLLFTENFNTAIRSVSQMENRITLKNKKNIFKTDEKLITISIISIRADAREHKKCDLTNAVFLFLTWLNTFTVCPKDSHIDFCNTQEIFGLHVSKQINLSIESNKHHNYKATGTIKKILSFFASHLDTNKKFHIRSGRIEFKQYQLNSLIVNHTTTEASLNELAKIKYKQIYHNIENQWLKNPVACGALTNCLKAASGNCIIDLGAVELTEEERAAILAPLEELWEDTPINTKIKQHLFAHFQLCDRSAQSQLPKFSPIATSSSSNEVPLSVRQTEELTQTLLYLKVFTLNAAIAEMDKKQGDASPALPTSCFVVSSSPASYNLELFTAISQNNQIVKLCAPSSKFIKTLQDISLPSLSLGESEETANLSADDLKTLARIARNSSLMLWPKVVLPLQPKEAEKQVQKRPRPSELSDDLVVEPEPKRTKLAVDGSSISHSAEATSSSSADSIGVAPAHLLPQTLNLKIQEILPQQKSLNLPIIDLLAHEDTVQPMVPFISILKPYQIDLAARLKTGVQKALCAQMGTGKTLIMLENIMQKIAGGANNLHLLLVPVSILKQVKAEATRGLLEALFTAWSVRAIKEENASTFSDDLNNLFHDLDYDLSIRMMIACFPAIARYVQSEIKPRPWLSQARLKQAVELHIQSISKNPRLAADLLQKVDEGEYPDLQLKDGLLTWSTSESINESVMRANAILSIGREIPLEKVANFDLEKARKISRLPAATVRKATSGAELQKLLTSQVGSAKTRILVTSLESLSYPGNLEIFNHIDCSSLTIDEADRLSSGNQFYRLIEQLLRKTSGVSPLLASGTPFRNNVSELYNLLSLVHTEHQLPAKTRKHIVGIIDKSVDSLTKLVGNPGLFKEAVQNTNLAFAHTMALSEVLRQLVLTVKIDDSEVLQAWGSCIPDICQKQVEGKVTDIAQRSLGKLSVKEEGFLNYFHDVQKIMLNPNLDNLKRDSEQFKSWCTEIRTCDQNRLEEILTESSLLSTLRNMKAIEKAMQNNSKGLLFVDLLCEADAMKALLERVYAAYDPHVDIYEGSLDVSKRSQIIRQFKTSKDKPHFMIISKDAGAVGLDLPEANLAISIPGYSRATEEQGKARLRRVGHSGTKKIYEIVYSNSLLHRHVMSAREEKRLWEEVLLSPHLTLEARFKMWCELIATICKREEINKSLSPNFRELDATLNAFDGLQAKIYQSADLDHINTMIEQIRPIPKELPALRQTRHATLRIHS